MLFLRLTFVAAILVCVCSPVFTQKLDFERERHKEMLRFVKEDVKKNYFDATLKGIDIEARYKLALGKMDQAQSIGQMTGIIGQFLIEFDDSHLFFIPPGKANKTDYGFSYRMAGEKCLIMYVDKESDAQNLGLRVGDELLSIAGYRPTRETTWKLQYLLKRLRPQPGVDVIVLKPNGTEAKYAIPAMVRRGKKVMDLTGQDLNDFIRESEDAYRRNTTQYYYDKLEGVFIWKMPSFSLEPMKVDDLMGKARKASGVIFDLRGNGGGRVDMLLRLISNVFAADVRVGDEKKRKETKEIVAKSRGDNAFAGKVVVLIDSGSASASEVFSRVIQLEKRGVIIGDRSAGAVMESRVHGRQMGLDTVIFYGTSITMADLIMKDGKSLEKVGVTPDVLMTPSGSDLAQRRDVVLSKAVEILGQKMSPEMAGALFPVEAEDDN